MDEQTFVEVDLDEMLNQLILQIREKEGDGDVILAKLRELANIAEKIDNCLSEQVEVPVKLVDRWNQLIRELYPDKEKDEGS